MTIGYCQCRGLPLKARSGLQHRVYPRAIYPCWPDDSGLTSFRYTYSRYKRSNFRLEMLTIFIPTVSPYKESIPWYPHDRRTNYTPNRKHRGWLQYIRQTRTAETLHECNNLHYAIQNMDNEPSGKLEQVLARVPNNHQLVLEMSPAILHPPERTPRPYLYVK